MVQRFPMTVYLLFYEVFLTAASRSFSQIPTVIACVGTKVMLSVVEITTTDAQSLNCHNTVCCITLEFCINCKLFLVTVNNIEVCVESTLNRTPCTQQQLPTTQVCPPLDPAMPPSQV